MLDALDGLDVQLWAVAFYAGLRRSELIGLRGEDVDLATSVIRVRRGWDLVEGEVAPKSAQGRRNVPIAAVLRDYLETLELMSEVAVFGSPNWIARTNERARKRWQDSDLQVITLHEARHTYASTMIAAGINIKALSVLMGHTGIAITVDLYGHLLPGSEDEAAALQDAYLARAIGGTTVALTVAHTSEAPV
jgi:integrase